MQLRMCIHERIFTIESTISDCDECSEQLILLRLPPFQEMSFYTVVHEKTYKEEGSLVLPTLKMANFVEHLKTMFCAIFEGVIHVICVK